MISVSQYIKTLREEQTSSSGTTASSSLLLSSLTFPAGNMTATLTAPDWFTKLLHSIRVDVEVEMVGNRLSIEQVQLLADALATSRVKSIILRRCGLDNDMLRVLSRGGLPRRSLQRLSLWWCEFDNDACPELLRILEQCPQLELLDLYGNAKLTSVHSLEKGLTFHSSIRTIGLGGTKVSEKEREAVRQKIWALNTKRTKLLSVLCSSHFRVGKASSIQILPTDMFRLIILTLLG